MAMVPSASAVSFSARPSAAVRPRAASASASASASAGAGRVRGVAAEGAKWWAPLLGWSGRADYIEAAAPVTATEETEKAARRRPSSSSSFVGVLTEEKARELRARMVETESFHDAMYHSAIASRLARSA